MNSRVRERTLTYPLTARRVVVYNNLRLFTFKKAINQALRLLPAFIGSNKIYYTHQDTPFLPAVSAYCELAVHKVAP